jgi:hypothetical protein
MLRYTLLFYSLYLLYREYGASDVANNLTSASHCAICIILSGFSLFSDEYFGILRPVSCGYFLFDIGYMLTREKITPHRVFFLYHHLAGIYFLQQDEKIYQTVMLLFFAEISNIPMFLISHYKEDKEKLAYWKGVQKYLYSLVRVPVFTWILLANYASIENKVPIHVMLPIYFIGIAYTFYMWK